MNKKLKIFLAILGGFDVIFYIISPILLVSLYIAFFTVNNFVEIVLYTTGFLSTLFRGIKVGWLK